MPLRVLVINLERDVGRWQEISAALSEKAIEVERIVGVFGPDLPDVACLILAGHPLALKMRGTLGTFLSHVKAWETVSRLKEPYVVILEDDAVLTGFDRIFSMEIPQDAEIVFINDRMSPGSRYSSDTSEIHCVSIIESLRVLNRTGHGVGGDGYLLKPIGASKLLEAVKSDLCFGHVDWRLLRYSVNKSDLDEEFAGTRIDTIVQTHHNPARPPAWGILKGYSLNSPLVGFATTGNSVRDEADRLTPSDKA